MADMHLHADTKYDRSMFYDVLCNFDPTKDCSTTVFTVYRCLRMLIDMFMGRLCISFTISLIYVYMYI